jgi:IS1 family transposase
MNRLPLEDRVRALAALVEGNSIRGTARMVGLDKKTVMRLLEEVGDACDLYQHDNLRNLSCVRVQCDEVWSFCHAKERNIRPDKKRRDIGDVWTWTAIDANTKLIITWHVGKRTHWDARRFIHDLSRRIKSFVQITTDGLNMYIDPIIKEFKYRADYGQDVKVFGHEPIPEVARGQDSRYSPPKLLEMRRTQVWGVPDLGTTSTAYVERQNLTMRMSMRRFTRLTNAFSKKIINHQRALALHFMHYNFCRVHQTLKTTPAIKHGLTDRIWTLHDLARLPELIRGEGAAA